MMKENNKKIDIDDSLLRLPGIDRASFVINIDNVDFSKYEHIKNTTMGTSSIDVSDYIDNRQFNWRIRNKRKYGKDILELDIVFPRVFYNTKHNVYNVAAKKAVKEALKKVLGEIKEKGIDIPLKSLVCVKVEINKTVKLDEDVNSYKDIFSTLVGGNCTLNEQEGGLTVSKVIDKKGKRIKLYDKTTEISNTIHIEVTKNLCRFEITISGDRVYRTFKTTDITKITQAQVNKLYKSEVSNLEKCLEDSILNDSEELYNRFKFKESITGSDLKLDELRTIYQSFDDEKRVVFSQVVEKAVKKYRTNYTRNMDTVRKIIGTESVNRFNNYDRAKNLLKKLKKK